MSTVLFTMDVSKKYGIIQLGKIRAMIYYPLSRGRNFHELKRVLQSLQAVDKYNIATPADWEPGDRVIVPPAGSCGTAKDRMEGKDEGVECVDWFFCTKELKEELV